MPSLTPSVAEAAVKAAVKDLTEVSSLTGVTCESRVRDVPIEDWGTEKESRKFEEVFLYYFQLRILTSNQIRGSSNFGQVGLMWFYNF